MKRLRLSLSSAAILLFLLTTAPTAYSRERTSQVPSFLQVGQWYVALYTGEPRRPLHFKVIERAGGAWIKVEHRDGIMWLNTDAALLIKPGTKQ